MTDSLPEGILQPEEKPQEQPLDSHERLYNLLMDEDEITWQSLILSLVKEEGMNPWDIDISKLTKSYISTLKRLKEMNLRISGKVLLAAAILLRIKSTRLVGEDLMAFDQMLAASEDNELLYEGEDGQLYTEEQMRQKIEADKDFKLVPRTPQPRKRKVSVTDLIEALEQALNVKRRRVLREGEEPTVIVPEKKVDISDLMNTLFAEIETFFSDRENQKLTFYDLCPEDSSREEKVFTLLPLLHLATGTTRKIDLSQQTHFGEILVSLAKTKPVAVAAPETLESMEK
ncbi:MAG: segregation/condensation protein A [Nanoarchaeota archaeon]|nr:segregation/condensation protein A [Nanoarchaeota archaeon]